MATPVDSGDPQLSGIHTNSLRTTNRTDATVIHNPQNGQERPSEEGGEVFEAGSDGPEHQTSVRRRQHSMQPVNSRTSQDPLPSIRLPIQNREEANRLDDELRMLQVERQISNMNPEPGDERGSTVQPSRSRRQDLVDDFDAATNPLHEKASLYQPPSHPDNAFAAFFKSVHQSSFLVRYLIYITPVGLILLIPLLLGALVFKNASVGGVRLVWFMIWLEIVWLTLWAGRVRHHHTVPIH